MTVSINIGAATSSAKNSDLAALQAAINDELKLYATKAEIEELKAEIEKIRTGLSVIGTRVGAIEQTPMPDHGHGPLTQRVEALEALIQRVPAENPQPISDVGALPRPAGIRPDEVSLVYDRATLYYHDMVLHAQRLDDTRWRLFAQLNFVVVSPVLWTYDEIVEGTPEEVYEHAHRRLLELADLKPQHDAVHERVRRMSEGAR